MSWSDPFGLFNSRCVVSCAQSVLILPKRYPVSPLNLPGTVRYQAGGVSLASSVGQSEEFVSLREYRPGDPLRHIHWRSWAKFERPIVKEFLDEFFVRHALVLDTFCSPEEEEVFEEAVSVAASFACTIPDQESLLDLMFVGPEAYCFTSGRGVAPPERMLEILAAVSPCAEHPFSTLERLLLRHVGHVTSCVCVFLAWDEARQALIQRLRFLGVPVQVYVVTGEHRANTRAGADGRFPAVSSCGVGGQSAGGVRMEMKPRLLLLAGALVFWGLQTGFVWVALVPRRDRCCDGRGEATPVIHAPGICAFVGCDVAGAGGRGCLSTTNGIDFGSCAVVFTVVADAPLSDHGGISFQPHGPVAVQHVRVLVAWPREGRAQNARHHVRLFWHLPVIGERRRYTWHMVLSRGDGADRGRLVGESTAPACAP